MSCAFSGSAGAPPGLVIVSLDSPGDSATLGVEGGEIRVNGAACASALLLGEVATNRNTDTIAVRDSSAGDGEVRIADPAAFGPGLANEGDGSAEIEFDVDLGAGGGDVLRIEAAGTDAADRYEFGAFGQVAAGNLNARSEDRDAEDVDIAIAGVERAVGDGRALDDKIDGDAGAPFSGPIPFGLESFGFDGEDTLRGGSAADLLHGGAGEDLLEGGDGRDVLLGEGEEDVLVGGEGPDRFDGGDDEDVADYRLAAGGRRGVTADLEGGAVGGAGAGDRLASVEGLLGTEGPDLVDGSAALNFIFGGAGRDRLSGAGNSDALLGGDGADSLDAGSGRDVVFAGDGRRDVVDCGPGRDGYEADRVDRLRSCEVKVDLRGNAAPTASGRMVRACAPGPRSHWPQLRPC